MQEDFDRLKLITRSWLQGAGMNEALRAVNLGVQWHTGTRKDGVTPEFVHQLSQIQHARSLAGITSMDLETIICVIALHDLPEDKRYGIQWIYQEFGTKTGLGVERMSKKYHGVAAEQSDERYYYDIGFNQHASVAKGTDRVHNQATMVGVFTVDKMFSYMDETEKFVLPMLKEARNHFPPQSVAYTALRHRLREQMFLIRRSFEIGFRSGSADSVSR